MIQVKDREYCRNNSFLRHDTPCGDNICAGRYRRGMYPIAEGFNCDGIVMKDILSLAVFVRVGMKFMENKKEFYFQCIKGNFHLITLPLCGTLWFEDILRMLLIETI